MPKLNKFDVSLEIFVSVTLSDDANAYNTSRAISTKWPVLHIITPKLDVQQGHLPVEDGSFGV